MLMPLVRWVANSLQDGHSVLHLINVKCDFNYVTEAEKLNFGTFWLKINEENLNPLKSDFVAKRIK